MQPKAVKEAIFFAKKLLCVDAIIVNTVYQIEWKRRVSILLNHGFLLVILKICSQN